MKRSIRTTLLFWYGLILLLVIGGFGFALDRRQERAVYDEVDAELRAHAVAIADAVEWDEREGFELEVSAASFRETGPEAAYFIVWKPDGEILRRSTAAPDRLRPAGPGFAGEGNRREYAVAGERETTILVGRGTFALAEDLRRFRDALAAIGAAAFLAALAAGWFLVGRVLRPIGRMTATASSISASDLSRRIDVGKTESELGILAKTLNEAFDRLRDAFERQTRFTADASHELRTPLSILISNIEVALKEDLPPTHRETLETCLRAANRMKGVADGLLTLARTDAGESAIKREPVDLAQVVRETASLLKTTADARRVEIGVTADPVVVTGDRDRLREVAANLISNAIRYNREGGRVEVSLRREGGDAVLAVRDTGIGIPPADLPRIFERFYRVDQARSRDMGGSGLGLAIVKWVVDAHGGTIAASSREGEGSEFTVRLPC